MEENPRNRKDGKERNEGNGMKTESYGEKNEEMEI